VGDKEVVEILGRFSDKLPTKGLVRVYLSMHSLVELEGIIFYFYRYVSCDNRLCFCFRVHGLVGKEEPEFVQDFVQRTGQEGKKCREY